MPNLNTLSTQPPRRRMTGAKSLAVGVAIVVVLALLPKVFDNSFLLTIGGLMLLNTIGALSLHLIIRTGHISFSHAAFMGVGGYTCVLSVLHLGVPPFLGLLLGCLASGLLALLVGPILLRLTGKYFVLVT